MPQEELPPRGPEMYKAADLEKELYWVRDPLKLADKIVALLKKDSMDDYFKAVALLRLASKNMLCTVSWNHMVDYNMRKGRVKAAVNTYNEVKRPPTGRHGRHTQCRYMRMFTVNTGNYR